LVEAQRQQVVHNLKSVLSRWNINSAKIGEVGELGVGVILEEGQDGHEAIGVDHHLELITIGHLHLLDVLGQALPYILSVVGVGLPHLEVDRTHR